MFLAGAALVTLLVAREDGPQDRAPGERAAEAERGTSDPEMPGAPTTGEESATPEQRAKHPWRVRGVVTGEDKAPIEGARVQVFPDPAWAPEAASLRIDISDAPAEETRTDAQGRFAITVPPGSSQIRVLAAGYVPNAVDVDPESTKADMTLTRASPTEVSVVDASGHPVPGARVLFYTAGESQRPVWESRTSALGRAQVPGPGYLMVYKPGYACATSWVDELDGPVVLRLDYRCGGTILDPDGKPLPDVEVEISTTELRWTARTDGEGRFLVEGLDRAELILYVEHAGYAPFQEFVTPGETDLRVTLRHFGQLSGRVLLPDGSPAAGAKVRFHGEHVVTNAAGAFRLTNVEPRDGELDAVRTWLTASKRLVVTSGARIENIEIRLQPAHRSQLDLEVKWADGKPVSGAEIFTAKGNVPIERLRYEPSLISTDGDGHARLRVADPPGTELDLIVTWAAGSAFHSARCSGRTVAPPSTKVIRLRFSPSPEFDLRLLSEEGRPPPNLSQAKIYSKPGVWFVRPTPIGARMAFNPASRPFVVRVLVPGYEEARVHRNDAFRPGERIDVRLRPGARVVGMLDEVPADANPELTLEDTGSKRTWTVDAGPLGKFAFDNLPPLEGRLLLHEGPFLPETIATVRVQRGQVLNLGTLRPPDRPALSVLVVDAAERPLGGVKIHILRTARDAELWAQSITRHDGQATLRRGARKAPEYLLLRKDGHGIQMTPVNPGGGTQQIVLARGGHVRLHVRHRPEVELPFASCRPSGFPFAVDLASEDETVPDGTVLEFRDLPVGPAVFRLGKQSVRAVVTRGETSRAELRWRE